MDNATIIRDLSDTIREKFTNDHTGHDWWHIKRVYDLSVLIAEKEKADPFICGISALVHEIPDWKFQKSEINNERKQVLDLLMPYGFDKTTTDHIFEIASTISFKGAKTETPMASIEGKVVQDADRLDAIGAVGIARAFTFGGANGLPVFDPEQQPVLHDRFDDYKKRRSTTINHFYEKLLLLKDRMNTQTGKIMAERRHHFLEHFLEAFHTDISII
jgi:uncharacterized protein